MYYHYYYCRLSLLGPRYFVQLVHVESAQPRTRATKVEPVHSVELVLFLAKTVALGLFA